jgi:hypothetical protein
MNVVGTIGKLIGVGDAVERLSKIADGWIASDADTQRLLLAVLTTLAPGLNVALAVSAVCMGIAAVGPFLVGSAAWLMRIASGPAEEPDLTVIGLMFGVIVTGKGADILLQYILDRAYLRERERREGSPPS